jgi:hypothetical protein
MPQIDFDGANSLVKTDKIQGQGGTTVTVPTGHTVAITDSGGLTLAGTAVNAGALGKVVQVVNTTTGASATGTTTMPHDDTIPQNSEGTEYMTLAITPTSSSNKLLIEWVANIATSAPMQMTTALFQDSTSNALAVLLEYNSNTNAGVVMSGKHYMAAGTTSSTTFKLRCASQNAATMTFNGYSGSRLYGGALASSITITEIAV